MNFKLLRVYALLLGVLLSIFPLAAEAQTSAQVKKLPPVNYIRSRKIDVRHVAIDLRFDWDKEQAYGSTVVTFAPFNDTNKISLDAAAMQINSVALEGGGNALRFVYDGKKENDNLEITLDRTYKRGENVSVKVDYRTSYVNTADAETAIGSFGRGLRFIKPTAGNPHKPRQIWSQGETEFNRYWFPSYDSPNDFRTSELRATVEKPFTVVSNGKLIEVKENADNTRTFHWKMDTPYTNYLTSIVVGEYAEVKQEWSGIPIINYAYKNETKEVAATVKNLPDMVRFFSEKTGVKYPYPKYAQTFVEEFGGGMENISATTMIEEMVHDERELLDGDSDSLQAHELAHQWFGDYVTTRDWGQIWLNESFATYFDALYHEHKKGHADFLYNNVRGNQTQYYDAWRQGNRRPIVTKNFANKDAMFDTYAYPRGAAVLHMLRKHLGDENWWRAINHYLVSNANQPVSTEDFRIAIEETTGESMDWFFDQWLYRMGHPVFQVTQNYDAAKKQLTLNVKQTQKIDPNNEFPQVEFFQTFVEIEIGTPAGTRIEKVWLEPKAENVFTFNVDAEPNLVNFDYEGTLIKELKFDKSIDELLYQTANDRDVLGKRWAMTEAARKAGNAAPAERAKVMATLQNIAGNDEFWRLRRAALSEIRALLAPPQVPQIVESQPARLDEATIQLLTKAARDENALVRADAISFLGLTRDERFADLYIAALGDPSYGVIDQAAIALGNSKSPKAYEALVKLANTPSWRVRLQFAGLVSLAQLGDKRAFELGYKLATDKTQMPNVRTSALMVVGATGKGDPRAYPLIFEQFKAALEANNLQGTFNGAQAIVKLGDPRGKEIFELMKTKFKGQTNLLNFVTILESQFILAVGK